MTNPATPVLEVRNLVKHFPIKEGVLLQRQVGAVQAVDGISLDVYEGETLAIVGESGCGKSTTARLIIGLIEPDGGKILFDGEPVGPALSLRQLRRRVQMVFTSAPSDRKAAAYDAPSAPGASSEMISTFMRWRR